MPSRVIREGILTSEPVNALSPQAEVFYRRLLNIVDDYGVWHASIKLLRAYLFPLQLDRVSEVDIAGWMEDCRKEKLVKVYEKEGSKYLLVTKFDQQVRTKRSKHPLPDE
jgi:hypothetical protein